MKMRDFLINIHLNKNSRWQQECLQPSTGAVPLPVLVTKDGSRRDTSESRLSQCWLLLGSKEMLRPSPGEMASALFGASLKALEMTGAAPARYLSSRQVVRINELISEIARGQIFTCLKEHKIFILSFMLSDNPFSLPLGFQWSVWRIQDKMMNLTQGISIALQT